MWCHETQPTQMFADNQIKHAANRFVFMHKNSSRSAVVNYFYYHIHIKGCLKKSQKLSRKYVTW